MADSDKPKIIIDEDWKAQVEREREELQQQPDSQEAQPADSMELPPASMPLLITTLATQTMAALGQLPDPTTGQGTVQLDLAKFHIDTLRVLQEKTKGNLDADESGLLEDAIHQLQMLYVATADALRST